MTKIYKQSTETDMKKNEITASAKTYNPPMITRINLDNEISLAMASDVNPFGEPEWSKAKDTPTNDPFHTGIA